MRHPRARVLVSLAVLAWTASCGDRSTAPIRIPPLPPLDTLLVVQEWQPAWSPNGRVIAYSHEVKPGYESELGTYGIYAVEVDSDSVSSPDLVVPISGAYWLSFAPDSRRIVYVWGGNLWEADVFTKDVRRLTTHGKGQKPAWHPRDEIIVYNRYERVAPDDSGSIRVIDVSTLDDTPVRAGSGRVLYGGGPAWDPAGRSIVYTRFVPTKGLEVFRVYPDSTEENQLTNFGWTCELPKWIDGGRAIAFRINPQSPWEPDFPDWWVIPETGGPPRPFYDFDNQIEVGANLAVGPGPREFVLTRSAAGNEHWLALWIVCIADDGQALWRQITGPLSL